MGSTLDELEPYILGKKYSGVCKKETILDEFMLEDFMTAVESDSIAKSFLDSYEVYTDFFDTMVDFQKSYPKNMWQELFYGAKLDGEVYRAVPSFCVFMLKKAYDSVYHIPNLIIKALPAKCINMFTQENYFSGGYSLRDVIQNVCNSDYMPLSKTNLKNEVDNFVEIYICNNDMVAAVPKDLAESLHDDGILEITETVYGLTLRDVPLNKMCGYTGNVKSVYDLRDLL